MGYLVSVLYIVAFAMFIYGLSGLTGPKTAVRGNYIAAVGMGIAVVAVLIDIRETDNWGLIIGGLAVGVILGVPPALKTKMTAMPQLVACSTVSAVAPLPDRVGRVPRLVELHHPRRCSDSHHDRRVLFAAIIGSISFWGSLVAFAKLQELLNKNLEKKLVAGAKLFQLANMVLVVASIAIAVYIGISADGEPLASFWIVLLLVVAGLMGLFVVLPIGGADMPVVISLLNALTGLSAAAAGLALNNQAMIVAGMIVGASGTILTNLMAKAMNRSIPAIVFGAFGGGDDGGAAAGPGGGTVKATSASDAAIQMRTPIRSSWCPATVWPSRRRSTPSRRWRRCSKSAASRSSTRFIRSPVVCRGT